MKGHKVDEGGARQEWGDVDGCEASSWKHEQAESRRKDALETRQTQQTGFSEGFSTRALKDGKGVELRSKLLIVRKATFVRVQLSFQFRLLMLSHSMRSHSQFWRVCRDQADGHTWNSSTVDHT